MVKTKSTKVAKVGIKRKPGFLYYIDKDGDISMVPMNRSGKVKKGTPVKEPVKKKVAKKATTKKKAVAKKTVKKTPVKKKSVKKKTVNKK